MSPVADVTSLSPMIIHQIIKTELLCIAKKFTIQTKFIMIQKLDLQFNYN